MKLQEKVAVEPVLSRLVIAAPLQQKVA